MGKRILLGLLVVLVLGGCGKAGEPVEPSQEPEVIGEVQTEPESTPELEESVQEPVEEVPVIYEEDALINLYLVRYNEANEEPVSREDFEIYYHHGRDHKDQIIFNGSGITVSSSHIGNITIVIAGSEEECKSGFMLYARGYNPELSKEDLERYWVQAVDSGGAFTQFEEFELRLQRGYSGTIDYITIEGKMEG